MIKVSKALDNTARITIAATYVRQMEPLSRDAYHGIMRILNHAHGEVSHPLSRSVDIRRYVIGRRAAH